MKRTKSKNRLVALLALLAGLALPPAARADLFVDGPTFGAPGQTLLLDIGLDSPLVQTVIDHLAIFGTFTGGVLEGTDLVQGALLTPPPPGSFFASPGPDEGTVSHIFLDTQNGLGAGVLATWSVLIKPDAVPGSLAVVTANLLTFALEDVNDRLTADLTSQPLTITVVPEPSIAWLLLAGLAGLGALRSLRRR